MAESGQPSQSQSIAYFLPSISRCAIWTIRMFLHSPLVWHCSSLVWVFLVFLQLALDIAHLSHWFSSSFPFCLLFCPLFHFVELSCCHAMRSFFFLFNVISFQWVRLQVVFVFIQFIAINLISFLFYFYFWVDFFHLFLSFFSVFYSSFHFFRFLLILCIQWMIGFYCAVWPMYSYELCADFKANGIVMCHWCRTMFLITKGLQRLKWFFPKAATIN